MALQPVMLQSVKVSRPGPNITFCEQGVSPGLPDAEGDRLTSDNKTRTIVSKLPTEITMGPQIPRSTYLESEHFQERLYA